MSSKQISSKPFYSPGNSTCREEKNPFLMRYSDTEFYFKERLYHLEPRVVNITAAALEQAGQAVDPDVAGTQFARAYTWSRQPNNKMITRKPLQMMALAPLGDHQKVTKGNNKTGKMAFDGFWGNHIKLSNVKDDAARLVVVRQFYEEAKQNPAIKARIGELSGKTLGCVCADKLCHGHALVRLWREWRGWEDGEKPSREQGSGDEEKGKEAVGEVEPPPEASAKSLRKRRRHAD